MPRRDIRRREGSVHSPLAVRGCLVNIALGSKQIRIGVYGQDLRAAYISRSMTYIQTGTLFDHMGIGDHEAAGIHEGPLPRERL